MFRHVALTLLASTFQVDGNTVRTIQPQMVPAPQFQGAPMALLMLWFWNEKQKADEELEVHRFRKQMIRDLKAYMDPNQSNHLGDAQRGGLIFHEWGERWHEPNVKRLIEHLVQGQYEEDLKTIRQEERATKKLHVVRPFDPDHLDQEQLSKLLFPLRKAIHQMSAHLEASQGEGDAPNKMDDIIDELADPNSKRSQRLREDLKASGEESEPLMAMAESLKDLRFQLVEGAKARYKIRAVVNSMHKNHVYDAIDGTFLYFLRRAAYQASFDVDVKGFEESCGILWAIMEGHRNSLITWDEKSRLELIRAYTPLRHSMMKSYGTILPVPFPSGGEIRQSLLETVKDIREMKGFSPQTSFVIHTTDLPREFKPDVVTIRSILWTFVFGALRLPEPFDANPDHFKISIGPADPRIVNPRYARVEISAEVNSQSVRKLLHKLDNELTWGGNLGNDNAFGPKSIGISIEDEGDSKRKTLEISFYVNSIWPF